MSTSSAFPLLAQPLKAVADRVGKRWWLLLIPGIAWVIIGFVVLRFDASTIAIVAVVFGIMVLLAAAGELFSATITVGGWRVFHVIFAVVLVVAAIGVFLDPDGAFVSLALVTGFYFVFTGTYDIVASLFDIRTVPGWWLRLISGVLQVLLGYLASSSLANSVLVLVTFVSTAALFRGIAEISAAFAARAAARLVTGD
ncbi:DUF308 domain-containing protein [Galbitalea sp. SE-J8]|uniref:HdeD family acid-resistance protein n=1 Tax=Galbitalea sp. SE-J8 TaxID=3054952 RepID=UPI00259CA0F0|nr:DUF308 domain-containing protein [Galbitalea sp. SE-J8]MDM4761985.1 DUF308 domain-containing protein [Galbitalea sp. SE-J8]